MKECHSSGVYHGDIKTENTLVTSWNWLFLSDFSASFKPTYLPEDNPADFSFFFDISGRRTCYLAPERFISSGGSVEGSGSVTWAMDIFSVGCVIAELFLENPIFNLSQLFNYRKGEFDPRDTHLSRIEDVDLRELISHMIQLEPESRYSADEYLNFWRQKTFPEYFYGFLHQYMYLITDPSSGRSAITSEDINFGESDDRIGRIYQDFDKISYFLEYAVEAEQENSLHRLTSQNAVFPLHLDIARRRKVTPRLERSPMDDGTFLFLSVVTSSLRSTARAAARLQGCELLLAFSEHIPDEAKLDRILPFIMSLIDDKSETVKITALRSLAQLVRALNLLQHSMLMRAQVALVEKCSPVNAYIFPEYIIPKLEDVFANKRDSKPSVWLRITHAQCLAALAETAARFLDTNQALKAEGTLPSSDSIDDQGAFIQAYQDTYDVARVDLVRFFESQTKSLLTDTDSNVRRTFVGSVAPLCFFFGSAKASDVILSHLNTYLNDKDWKLKCAFFDAIIGVATYVGSNNLEEFILPLMIPALSDPEEFVVERVIRSFSILAQLGLLQRSTTWDLIDVVARFTMHPSPWIREGSADFIASSTSFLSIADCRCIVQPRVAPYMTSRPSSYSKLNILDCLKRPLTRSVFELASFWVLKSGDSTFWRPVQKRRTSNKPEDPPAALSVRELGPSSFAKIPKNDEDHKWISRLRDNGMTFEDEYKLLALSDYIWLTAKRKSPEEPQEQIQKLNQLLRLSELSVPLNNVTFENQRQVGNGDIANQTTQAASGKLQTIADALLDASTRIGEEPSSQGSSNGTNTPSSLPGRFISMQTKDTSPRISSPLSSSPPVHAFSSPKDVESEPRSFSKQPTISTTDRDPGVGQREQISIAGSKAARAKESAIDLMPGRDSSAKATAETSTSSASAIGKVNRIQNHGDLPVSDSDVAAREHDQHPAEETYKGEGGYNYSGRDPSVLKLLDSLYVEHYPLDTFEFGPIVTPLEHIHIQHSESEETSKSWRPEGSMVSMFTEHTGPITSVLVSPDHLFFITGSDDGTVKVWDTGRLERNIAHHSRQTFRHSTGERVTGLCFIENTHCFVSTASDGSVKVVKVDCSIPSQGSTKYGKLTVLRQWRIPRTRQDFSPQSDGSVASSASETQPIAMCIGQYRSDPYSLLHIATDDSLVHALDLRTMKLIYTLENPVQHGTPRTFCLGRNKYGAHHWLLLGTSYGVCDLWDLRFRLRLRSFAFPGSAPIERITLHPNRGSSKSRVIIAGGTGRGDVTVWDLEKLACKEVYRTSAAGRAYAAEDDDNNTSDFHRLDAESRKRSSKKPNAAAAAAAAANAVAPSLKPYTPWYPDNTSASDLGSRLEEANRRNYRRNAKPDSSSNKNGDGTPDPPALAESDTSHAHQIRALVACSRSISSSSISVHNGTLGTERSQNQQHYLITAGGGPHDVKIRYWDMHRIENSCIVNGLIKPVTGSKELDEPKQPTYGHIGPIGRAADCIVYEEHEVPEESKSRGIGGRNLLNEHQQRMLKSHLDTVLDVAVIERPCWMVVSVDRGGTIFVFS